MAGPFVMQLARCRPATPTRRPNASAQEYVRNDRGGQPAPRRKTRDIELIDPRNATDEPDGSLMLYWAILPWVDGAETLGRGKVGTPSEQLVAAIGTALLEKTGAAATSRGRLAPNLSEQMLVPVQPSAPAWLPVGLPIHLPDPDG